jgi:hypothetical protein
MTALIRFTLGNTTQLGRDILGVSVERIREIYPECDICVCHNQIDPLLLAGLSVPLVDQSLHLDSIPFAPEQGYHVHWKLYPPRLRPGSHEIFIDNDIVITERIAEIDNFLRSESDVLLYQGLHGLHGTFHSSIPAGVRINSGIFGLAPDYDFRDQLRKTMKKYDFKEWLDPFDEQGLVAATLFRTPHHIVPLTAIPVVERRWSISHHRRNRSIKGYHFVHSNQHEDHLGANEFLGRV